MSLDFKTINDIATLAKLTITECDIPKCAQEINTILTFNFLLFRSVHFCHLMWKNVQKTCI